MIDPHVFLEGAGLLGCLIVGAIIFAESALLIGFFLPGDTLLFPAGFFAAQGQLPLAGLLGAAFIGSVIGNEVGYLIGKKTGPRLFRKKDGLIFKQEYVQKAEAFYEKHGGKTVILARFLPIVRTFVPLVAGVSNMDRKKYFFYNVVGGAIWVVLVVMLGYWLGSKIPNIEHYMLPAVAVAMILSFGPTALHLLREERLRNWLKDQSTRVWNRLTRRTRRSSSDS